MERNPQVRSVKGQDTRGDAQFRRAIGLPTLEQERQDEVSHEVPLVAIGPPGYEVDVKGVPVGFGSDNDPNPIQLVKQIEKLAFKDGIEHCMGIVAAQMAITGRADASSIYEQLEKALCNYEQRWATCVAAKQAITKAARQ